MWYIEVGVCYIFLVSYIFYIKKSTSIVIHMVTSECPVLLQKCLGHQKVIIEVTTVKEPMHLPSGSYDPYCWSSDDGSIPLSPNAMELSRLYTYQVSDTL
jgi:hypothetical protein